MASKRASVSLPNVLDCGNVKLSKSATSTPQKKHISSSSSSSSGILSPKKIMMTTNSSSSCSSITRSKASGVCTKVNKGNISIIAEVKENPNYSAHLTTAATSPKEAEEQQLDEKVESIKQEGAQLKVEKQVKRVETNIVQSVNTTAIQCNLQDELMMTSDDKWESIYYFKLLFHKRVKAINETRNENREVK